MGSSLAAAILLSADATVRTQALPGKAAGTEQWIVELRTRGFDLRQELAEARGMPTQAERRQKLLELRQLAALDQAAFAADLQAAGGAVRRHLWVVNALVADIPAGRLDWARLHARVRRLWPNEARRPGCSADDTGGLAVDDGPDHNHNIANAWAVPQPGGLTLKGDRVTIAVMDTGLDRNHAAGTGSLDVYQTVNIPAANPHPTFHVESGHTLWLTKTLRSGSAFTRLWESYRPSYNPSTNHLDVNDFYQPSAATAARHGTGVAGIAAGIGVPGITVSLSHAPRALLVGWSITEPNADCPSDPIWVTSAARWLVAIEDLRAWLTMDPDHRAHVLNLSFHGWPDPAHPVSRALDALSSDPDTDTLVVVLAGNEGDATFGSHGSWHALSVGAVHRRTLATQPYVPMIDTSRGPLVTDRERPFPDVCAMGAGTTAVSSYWQSTLPMPLADDLTQNYQARGTSMAAPQVSGAAALYRARRLAWGPSGSDSALETKAAILLNVDDPFSKVIESTYQNRNTFGVGFTRDDWLVEYAERLPALKPLAQTVQMGSANMTGTLWYPVIGGKRYAVVAAWFYPAHEGYGPDSMPVVELEVVEGTTVIGRSASRRSSFERVVFTPVVSGSVRFNLALAETPSFDSDFDVFVAARELPAELQATAPLARAGEVNDAPQAGGCTGDGSVHRVQRTIPVGYTRAYGSYPIAQVLQNSGPGATPPGQQFGGKLGTTSPPSGFNTIIAKQHVGGDFDAVGIALRSWLPFVPSGASSSHSVQVDKVCFYETADSPGSVKNFAQAWPPSNAVNPVCVLNNPRSVTVARPAWSAADWDTWAIVIPFDVTYRFRGSASGLNLGIWVEFQYSPDRFQVDWIDDGPPYCNGALGYASWLWSGTAVAVGSAPVLGLIEPAASANLPPALSLIGEPRVNETLKFRVEQLPAGAAGALNLGLQSANSPLPTGCAILTTIDASWGFAAPVPWSPWTLVDVPAFTGPWYLRHELHWQVVTLTGAGDGTASNALTTKLGGLHQ